MIKKKRLEKSLTQGQLAEKIGISESYMCRIEKYPHFCNPTINIILKMSEELDIDPIKIFLYFIESRFKER